MKNTAKTLTLTAKKAPAKSTAQLAVPKTATSYFLETEAAAKVTVVKTRSRLASLKAVQAEEASRLEPEQFDEAAAAGEAQVEAVAADVLFRSTANSTTSSKLTHAPTAVASASPICASDPTSAIFRATLTATPVSAALTGVAVSLRA